MDGANPTTRGSAQGPLACKRNGSPRRKQSWGLAIRGDGRILGGPSGNLREQLVEALGRRVVLDQDGSGALSGIAARPTGRAHRAARLDERWLLAAAAGLPPVTVARSPSSGPRTHGADRDPLARAYLNQPDGAGQILASETVHSLLGSRGGHEFVALGDLELKGLPPLATVAVRWGDDAPVLAPTRGAKGRLLASVPLTQRLSVASTSVRDWMPRVTPFAMAKLLEHDRGDWGAELESPDDPNSPVRLVGPEPRGPPSSSAETMRAHRLCEWAQPEPRGPPTTPTRRVRNCWQAARSLMYLNAAVELPRDNGRTFHTHEQPPLTRLSKTGVPPQVAAWARSISHHKKFLDWSTIC
jgi:hypothetical protein